MATPTYWHLAYSHIISRLRGAHIRRIDFTKFSELGIATRHALIRCGDAIGGLENQSRVGPLIRPEADYLFYIERVRE